VQPPIRAQSCCRPLAVCLNTSDVVFTRVPAGGIGFFVAQPDTNSVHKSNAVKRNSPLFVRFMTSTLSLVLPSDILASWLSAGNFSILHGLPPFKYVA
jgi:hypothetical protein